MSPALQASAAMFARRQFAGAPTSTSSLIVVASRLMATQQHQKRGYATPMGPPPRKFRTSRQVEWPWDKEGTLDRLGKYFLLTEMARGMYVLMEQFFRPPYVEIFAMLTKISIGHLARCDKLIIGTQIHDILSLREGKITIDTH